MDWIACANKRECLQLFIDYGADTKRESHDGTIPLHMAAAHGNIDCLALLISHGAPIDKRSHNGSTQLHLAARYGHTECSVYLIKYGADPKKAQDTGLTVLHLAAGSGDKNCLQTFIEQDLDIEKEGRDGSKALHWAAFKGHRDCLELLIKYGAQTKKRLEDGETALHLAASFGNTDCLKLIIKLCGNIDKETFGGITALHLAAENGHEDCVSLLTKSLHKTGARKTIDLIIKNVAGDTSRGLVHLAARGGHIGVLRILLEEGYDQDAWFNGKTALFDALSGGHYDVVTFLLEAHANPYIESATGVRFLEYAARRTHLDDFSSLLKKGYLFTQFEKKKIDKSRRRLKGVLQVFNRLGRGMLARDKSTGQLIYSQPLFPILNSDLVRRTIFLAHSGTREDLVMVFIATLAGKSGFFTPATFSRRNTKSSSRRVLQKNSS